MTDKEMEKIYSKDRQVSERDYLSLLYRTRPGTMREITICVWTAASLDLTNA